MPTKKTLTLCGPYGADDADRLVDTERSRGALPPEASETPPLDAEPEADLFYLTRRRPQVASEVSRVDARGSVPVIHNSFFVAGKVPSLNDLLEARGAIAPAIRSIIMRQRPGKAKSRGARFDLYNEIKQDWSHRTIHALPLPFVRVQACYFGYVVVEQTLKRDPSNVCSAAIKFIEDGLVKVGAIPNDGWKNILGIRMVCIHRPGRDPGVYVVMSDVALPEERLVAEYEDAFVSAESF